MKFSVCLFALVALANASVYIPATFPKIFQLSELLWFKRPKIPQIILDTGHPWLADNKEWLSSYPNIRTAICSKDSDLWTKPTTTQRALPLDLLTNITINNNKHGWSRLRWTFAGILLRELEACPAALEDVKNLDLHLYVRDFQYDTWTRDAKPPSELPLLFAGVLSKMPNLSTLRWEVQPKATDSFEDALTKANVTLSNLKHLVDEGHNAWLVRRCPNLEKISISYVNSQNPEWRFGDDPKLRWGQSSMALINATEGLPLQSIHMAAMSWRSAVWMELLEAIVELHPNLTDIGIDGDVYNPAETGATPEKLPQLVESLARFSNLKSLALPHSFQLGLGFDGGHWCGNAYGGASGRAYGRQVAQEHAETIEKAANMAIEALPQLKQLSFGGLQANLTVDEDGKVELVWPWTGRMEEYTYDIWPEPEVEDSFDDKDEL
ncbi:hypothetical protein SLS60_011563 [Paraconiothyrium brasiliense]|uniref:Uncharacterized protein n=1 Tax=Paraconiothyrium brasiliense TaxID=300254 RepID=A0ABR3QII2_9PLEO